VLSEVLYPYREQLTLEFHKRFGMSEFVRNSLTAMEETTRQLISEIPRGARIGIFGTYDSAQVLHLKLRQRGHRKICFIKSKPRMKSLRGSPIVDSGAQQLAGFDVIITSSLASSAGQFSYLQEQGFAGQIIRLPDLKHLGIALMRDLATNERIKQLQGSQAGRPAFIIGNGPSLSETDPRRIGETALTFAGNGIVKLDDAGLYLCQKPGEGAWPGFLRWFGRRLLAFAPWLMKALAVIGTAAMFMVGGGILVHGIHALEVVVHHLVELAGGIEVVGPTLAAVTPTLVGMVVGVIAGAGVLGLVKAWGMVRPSPA
jgi:hypothetical protein